MSSEQHSTLSVPDAPATAAREAQVVPDALRSIQALRAGDTAYAGGKGANLGELQAAGMPVPPAFVVGAPAYAAWCEQTGVRSGLAVLLDTVDIDQPEQLAEAAAAARRLIDQTAVPNWLQEQIRTAYSELAPSGEPVAVRSSATAEDTAEASFAGMNETFLNVSGAEEVIAAVRRCWRSLFGVRTIYYRGKQGLAQSSMDIAVIVQRQIISTRAGVMFTVNPATAERTELVIEGSFGLGEAVVSGSVSPDRYVIDKQSLEIRGSEVHRKELLIEADPAGGTITRKLSDAEALQPVLTDDEVHALAKLGCAIERHYGAPQDTEWAFDAGGQIWMLQSRPITTLSEQPSSGSTLLHGLGAAPGRASGPARILSTLQDSGRLQDGEVLVTHMTAPDWVPLMRRAAAIVTDSGGMTCHAAIVSRELGIPCIVGTGDATSRLHDGQQVLVDATRGLVLAGSDEPDGASGAPSAAPTAIPITTAAGAQPASAAAPITATRLLVNLSEPSQIERAAGLDVDGVGLLRAEMMVLEALDGDHPRLLIEEDRSDRFVDAMASSLQNFALAFDPRPITYRSIDFRTNEFRGLRGGDRFEPHEANPMIGYRGALRYIHEPEVFALELEALARVWDAGHHNLHLMLPFVRSSAELAGCRAQIEQSGLLGPGGMQLWVMAEVPSVLFNLPSYAALGVHGISIGSNDLTQLLLGADRDNEVLAETFDERDPAVVAYIKLLIEQARRLGLATSICGQAPSVHPEYAQLLVEAGIDAVSVNIDAVAQVRRSLARAEQGLLLSAVRAQPTPQSPISEQLSVQR